ncbi:MAG: hypothetical protein HYY67_07745 [Thaumarchaeota archaeon]|nr:hypothetical protein [Nitrososphaerota archaeon]
MKTVLLLPIFLAVAIVGYLAISPMIGAPAQQAVSAPAVPRQEVAKPPANVQEASKPKEQVNADGGQVKSTEVKPITIRLTNDGFDAKAQYTLTVKQGDKVQITYEDTYGDLHPIFISDCGIAFDNLSPQTTQSTIKMDCQPGKYAMYCLNTNCKTHNSLSPPNGGIITVLPG